MRTINRAAILEFLRLAKAASRTDIAEHLHISLPSVSRIVEGLIDSGLVREVGKKTVSHPRGRGQVLLEINLEENLVIGIDLGGSHIYGGLVNLGGQILKEYNNTAISRDSGVNYRNLVEFLQTMLADASKQPQRMLGIAIGVPGIVDSASGIVKLAPAMGWKDFPLLKLLEKNTFLPIILENDVNLATLGEHWFGAGQYVRDMVMIAIGTGIGAGVLLDGVLHRGFTDAAGEIGYILPGIDFLNRKYPGFGALESVASGTGITERARALLSLQAQTTTPLPLDAEQVFAAASAGEAWAQQTIAETVDYYSLAIANIAACLDPELIILGGGVANSSAQLIDALVERLRGVIPSLPRIDQSPLGEKAAVLGAVERVFKRYTDYQAVSNR